MNNNDIENVALKYCKGCEKDLPKTSFHKNGITVHPICLNCRSKERASKRYERKEGTKYCYGCNETKNVNEFHTDRSQPDGLQGRCKACKNITRLKYLSTYDGYLKNLFKDLKINAKRRKIDVEITLDDIEKIYNKQNRQCIYTGHILTSQSSFRENTNQHIINKWNISIDRINPSKNYTIDNIQIVGSIINRIKFDMNDKEFLLLCECISYNHVNNVSLNYFNEKSKLITENIITNIAIQKWACSLKGYIKKLLLCCYNNQKRRVKKLEITITENDLLQLYNEQEGKCKLTNINMTHIGYQNNLDTKQINNLNMSIDRIDSNKGYIIDNIQLVCACINRMKSDLHNDEFLELVKMVNEYKKNSGRLLPPLLEN